LRTQFPGIREINREFFAFDLGIAEFCPKSANFVLNQGITREFSGYLFKPASMLGTMHFNEDSEN
jgi:hypothetical protein